MKIYMAGPLFTAAERDFNACVAGQLRDAGHEVWLPQEFEHQLDTAEVVFEPNVIGLDWCDFVLANMNGSDPDNCPSGTCWEVGSVFRRKPVVLYRTDVREEAPSLGPYNLMLHQASNWLLDCAWLSTPEVARRLVEEIEAFLADDTWQVTRP